MKEELKNYITEVKANNPLQKVLIGLLLLLLFAIFNLYRSCGSIAPSIAKVVKTKEIKGKFSTTKIEQTPIKKNGQKLSKNDKSKNTSVIYKDNPVVQKQIDSLIKINDKLNDDFYFYEDSIKQVLYANCNELKEFKKRLENDTVTIDISGLVRGNIERLDIDYLIKSQKIEVPKDKQVVFRLLVGGGVGINKDLNQLVTKLNLDFQNKKGKILGVEYMKIENNDYLCLNYKTSLFTIKR